MKTNTENAAGQAIFAKLEACQRRARELADMRDANETRWAKLYQQARQHPGCKAYCEQTGSCESCNYGDTIC